MEKKYYIRCNNKLVEVSEEVYHMYYSSKRKERYFERDLKKGSVTIDMEEEKVHIKPRREWSLEEMLEQRIDFPEEENSIQKWEYNVNKEELIAKLHQIIKNDISTEERSIIIELFFYNKSERQLSRETGIPQKTINYRKNRLLEKLRSKILK